MVDVALVCPPFWSVNIPSLALGILDACLEREGINSKQYYFSLKYAREISASLYGSIGDHPGHSYMLGEWVFGSSVFPSDNDLEEDYINYTLHPERVDRSLTPLSPNLVQEAKALRILSKQYIDEWAQVLLADNPKIVAISNVFQQNTAALSLAKKIKEIDPSIYTVLGGANCEGPAGKYIVNNFSFIDAVVNGEAEESFIELVKNILSREIEINIPGIITQYSKDAGPATKVVNINSVPIPKFESFFSEFRSLGLHHSIDPEIVFETSRGCWWGQKHHCTFCGINTDRMAFRSKDPLQAIEELKLLSEKYGVKRVFTTDNIMDQKYYKTFLPLIKNENLDLDIYYELKSNIKEEQLQLLKSSGVYSIQPGIESFSDDVLKLVNKGSRASDNLKLLIQSEEIGLEVCWNLLFGFPGEQAEFYNETIDVIPKLTHLHAPGAAIPFCLIRFSPYHSKPEQYGIRNIKPDPAYKYMFSQNGEDKLLDFAYYFTFTSDSAEVTASYQQKLTINANRWKKEFYHSILFFKELDDGGALVVDTRTCTNEDVYVINQDMLKILKKCENGIKADAFQEFERELSSELLDRSLVVILEQQALSVALNIDNYQIDSRNHLTKIRESKVDMVKKIYDHALSQGLETGSVECRI